jgi:hypothetical protein
MVILLSLNFPYEQSEMPFDVLPRRQDFYGSQLFGSSFNFEPPQLCCSAVAAAAAVHTAISELQSLQSGRSASIATRPPYDNLKASTGNCGFPPSGTRSVQLSERKRGTLSLSDTR